MRHVRRTEAAPRGDAQAMSKWPTGTLKTILHMRRADEKRFNLLRNVAQGQEFIEAAQNAGYKSIDSARASLKNMGADLPQLLNDLDVPLPRVLHKMKDLLDAKETKFFSNKGVVVETHDVDALDIQLRTAVELADMHGVYAKPESASQIRNEITVVIEDVSRDVSRTSARTITAEATRTQ